MMYPLWILLWASTVVLIDASSSIWLRDPDKCGVPKCKVPEKFNYQLKTKYLYKYSISTNTTFDGAPSNSSNMVINALVEIRFRSECEGVLAIKEADIDSSDGQQYETSKMKSDQFQSSLSENLLRFSFDDGIIKQVCPSKNESTWVLNFKKGILSSFQNSMDRFDVDQEAYERDVNGDCLAKYFFKEINGTTLVISRKSDIKSCVNRYQVYSIIPTTPYIFQKKYHRWTPMKSDVTCNQYIDHKIYKGMVCEEEHAFVPFYNQSSAVKTSVRSKLSLMGESRLSTIETIDNFGAVDIRDNLLFDHRRPKKASDANLAECRNLITLLCELHEEKFQPKYPDVFNRFAHIARDLSSDALTRLYKESPDLCKTGKKHMLDALPYIRSRASVKVMSSAVLDNDIPSDTINEWLLVMSFFPRPNYETIESASELLLKRELTQEAVLSVSTMIFGYCGGQKNCHKHEAVAKSIERLESVFNGSIYEEDFEKAYISMKGIGNAGVLTATLASSLNAVITNETLPMIIRLAAIEAHRRIPCDTNSKTLLGIFQNKTVSEELRIAAYLQMMKCPSYSTIRAVKHALDIEEYNQVGSFVWSHLRNQMVSSQPSRVDIQAMLQDEVLKDKFNKDFRRFSRNYESSFYLNTYGVGGFVETNVIFTHESYIPRTIYLNFTVNVFGETLNTLQLTFRLEGLEEIAEKLFYGDAVFSKESFAKALKLLRVVRSAPNFIKEFIKSVPFKKIMDSIKMSVEIKMFGNDLRYYTIRNHREFMQLIESLNPMKILQNFMSGQEVTFDRLAMLIDTSYITPMACGIPLKLNGFGTAAINLNAMGRFNATGFSKLGKMDIEGKLHPSIGVNVEGSMEVDSFISQTGVKFKGSVFTSTALEGRFEMDNLKLIRATFNLPMIKSDIFHGETQFLLLQNDREILQKGYTADRIEKSLCSWSIFDDTIGLKLCATTLLPNSSLLLESPLQLFNGPLKFAVFLEKSDPTANTYLIEYRLDTFASNKSVITLKLETPGSLTKRGLKAVIDLDTQSQNLTLVYQSTLTHIRAQGFYKNTKFEKLVNFGLDINGKKHIDIQVGFEVKEGKYGNTYLPKLLFGINGKRIAELSGSIKWVAKKGISQCDIDLNFQTNKFETNIIGHLRLSDASFATNVKMDYRFGNDKFETVRIELKLGNKSSKFLTYYSGELQLESTAYPDINMVTIMKFQKAQSHTDWYVSLFTNPFVEDDNQKLRIMWVFQQYKALAMNKLNTSIEIVKPNSDIDIKLGLTKQDTATNSSYSVMVRYARGKEIVINLDLNVPHGVLFYFEGRLIVKLHGAHHSFNLFTKIHEKIPREYDVDVMGTWFSGHNMTVKGMYQDKSTLILLSYSLKLLARSPLFNDVLFVGRLITSDIEYRADAMVEHNDVAYGINAKHGNPRIGIYETFGEVIYNRSSYSFNNLIDVQKRKTSLELHFDRFRDVHITLHGYTNKTVVDAGLDLKWDANRDPSRKVSVIFNSNSLKNMNYDGRCIIDYPGKTITSIFFIQHKQKDYILSFKVEWSPQDMIVAYFQGVYDLFNSGIAEFNGKIETPFKKWEHLSIGYQVKFEERRLSSNGSVVWQDNQRLNAEVSYYYIFLEDLTQLSFVSFLHSTIPEVNSMKAIVKHNQQANQFASEIVLQTNPNNTISIEASGGIYSQVNHSHYNASFMISTPFAAVRKASTLGELHIYPGKFECKLRLIGNGKKYTTTVKGVMEVITESLFNFQIETPFEKYKAITGKLMYSASNKTFLADLKSCVSCISPASLGAELIYVYHNTSNFNLKLGVHSSISFVSNLLIVGKRDPETIDGRFIWNALMIGIIARSHYATWKDFEYGLKLFTPIEGYQTATAVAKLILIDRVDMEALVHVAEKKVGLKIQAMSSPDQDFAVPEIQLVSPPEIPALNSNATEEIPEPEPTPPPPDKSQIKPITLEEIYFGTVYWRGYFQLDTPMYPTVHGLIQILQDEPEEYNTLSFFSFPFGKLRLEDNLNYKNWLNLRNDLKLQTTCNCLEIVTGEFKIEGEVGKHINTDITATATLNNKTYDGLAFASYDYTPLSEESNREGYYNFTVHIESPLPMLNYTHASARLLIESPMYGVNASVVSNNSSMSLDGVLETDNNYFTSDIGFSINSPLLVLPMCRLNVHKDFTDFEKKMEIKVSLPNEKGNGLVHYGIGGVWHYDGPNYLKCSVEIITPYPKIGTMKGSVQYTCTPNTDHYFLDAYIKYSNNTEIKASCSVLSDNVAFKIDSILDSLQNVRISGALRNNDHANSLEVILSADKVYKMLAWATIVPHKPIMIDLKLFRTATNEEIFSLIVNANRTNHGYDINATVLKQGYVVNVECDYTLISKIGRKLNLMVHTTYPGYESLNLNAVFLNDGYHIMMYNLSGRIRSKWTTTNMNSEGTLSFQDNGGIIHVRLDSPNLSANIQTMWMMLWFENLVLDLAGKGRYANTTKEISTHLHFWNKNNEFRELSVSSDLNFNNKDWWLCTNATLIWPTWNDFKFMSFGVLPNKKDEVHTVLGRFVYEKDSPYFAHIFKYFRQPNQFDFLTMSEISLRDDKTKAAMLIKTGKHRIYNNFKLLKVQKAYDMINVLQSTNMKEEITLKLNYVHPSTVRKIRVSMYYPFPKSVLESSVDFTTINNFLAKMNCSTPFKTFPQVDVLLDVITTAPLYLRFIKVKWTNESAVFNYTHASKFGAVQFTDGSVLIDFPLATRHIGLLKYIYESTEAKATGRSSLSYNGDQLMSGNYTRISDISDRSSKDHIAINAENGFMPIGIIYNHRINRKYAHKPVPYTEERIAEIEKLNNKSAFHFIGEYRIDQGEKNKLITLEGTHFQRKLIVQSFTEGENSASSANFTLKSDVWFGCGLQMLHKGSGKVMEFNVSYPRRSFAIVGDYEWTNSRFMSEITIHPNKFKKAMSLSGSVIWITPDPSVEHITVIVAHPTFNKNITLSTSYLKRGNILLNYDSSLEYSTDANKRLVMNGKVTKTIKSESPLYEFQLFTSHPASRLNITGLGYVTIHDGIFELDENITYQRSYLPQEFWYTKGRISIRQKYVELEKKSLRDLSYFKGKYGKIGRRYYLNSSMLNEKHTQVSSDFFLDLDQVQTELVTNFTPDASETLRMKGWYRDNRHAVLDIWRTYDDISINDVNFFARLNHSRLLTCALTWRPTIRSDIIEFFHSTSNYMWNYAVDTANFWTTYIKSETVDSVTDIWLDAKPIVQDFIDDVKDTRDIQDDIEWIKELFTQAYEANEFYMQDIYQMYLVFAEEMSFRDKMAHVPKIINELYEVMGETGETIRQSILWLVESVKTLYAKIVVIFNDLMSGETIHRVSEYLKKLAKKYDKIIKDTHISFIHYMEHLWLEGSDFIAHYWAKTLTTLEPSFIQFAHYIESVFWEGSKKTLEFIYEKQSELLKSSMFIKNTNFTKDLDGFYQDLTNNDFMENLKKYLSILYDLLTEKYFSVVPFGNELNKIGSEIVTEVTELYKLPFVNFTIEFSKDVYNQVKWMYSFLKVRERVQQLIPLIYKMTIDLTHTALDNEMINHEARTLFIFEPNYGKINLEQKLPVPWHAFNDTPNYEEIPEYKFLLNIQKMFTPSNRSFWTLYYTYVPLLDPSMWFPPFDGQAMIIGNRHFVTFDGKNYEFSGECSYLMSNDFIGDTFSLVLKYTDEHQHVISLMVGNTIINIDLIGNLLSIENHETLHLPLEIDGLSITAEEGVASIVGKKGFSLDCNFKYDVCTFTLSGWYFGKTAGLLGTLDNEEHTDFLDFNGHVSKSTSSFIRSWSIGNCTSRGELSNTEEENPKNTELCYNLFRIKTSSFAPCYGIVNPKPYQEICMKSYPDLYDDEICTSAQAYIKACRNANIPLKIPSFCVECTVNNIITLDEGDMTTIGKDTVPPSTDVVFIMEAKGCNEYMRDRRMVHTFVSILTKELKYVGLMNNRFALVTYGGDGVFDAPHSVVFNNHIFTTEKNVPKFFERIKSGNGNSDIFGALRYATKLHFRPGVSKTFILVPCSDCDLSNMTVEYTVLNHAFFERNVTLHVLMNADFDREKLKVNKVFYGLDSERAYTKNDFKVLKGDIDLRRQIKLTKSMMGYCTTLALETNGTIFTGKVMGTENMALVKKFSSVFARRIAATAHPDPCQTCECMADGNGIEHIECSPCLIPVPAYSDFDFKENGTLSFLQAFEQIGDID